MNSHFCLERETGFEPATTCLEGRNSTRLSYSRSQLKYTNPHVARLQLTGIDYMFYYGSYEYRDQIH